VLVVGLIVIRTEQVTVLGWVAQDQMRDVELLTRFYLNGLSAAILPAVVRRDAREVFDALDRARGNGSQGVVLPDLPGARPRVKPRFAILELPNGTILASSDPRRFPDQSAVPDELRRRFAAGDGLEIDLNTDRAWVARTLRPEGFPVGRLFAEVDIPDSRDEIALTLVLVVNGCMTLAIFALDYFVLSRIFEWFRAEGMDIPEPRREILLTLALVNWCWAFATFVPLTNMSI
jgi:hypothetical protein